MRIYNGEHVHGYRLGDAAACPAASRLGRDVDRTHGQTGAWKGRLAARALQRGAGHAAARALWAAIRSGTVPAPADTLVVHLRIGDVIEAEDLIPPGELAARGRPRREIGRPRMRAMGYKACRHPAELRRRIFSAPEIIASARRCRVPRVELVGGSHNCERCPRSQAYIRELQSRLTRAGLTVELRLGGDPDEDFAHMVMAPHFMGHEHCGHYAETILRVRSVRQGKRRKGRRGTGRKRRPTRPGVRRRRLRTLA